MKSKMFLFFGVFVIIFMFSSPSFCKDGGGWLGISIKTLEPEDREYVESEIEEGVLVTSVKRYSPAYETGIKAGDIIIEFDGQKVYTASQLVRLVNDGEPGDKVVIVLIRDKKKKSVIVTLGEIPEEEYDYKLPHIKITISGYGWLGIQYVVLNKELGEYFPGTDGKGILITDVEEGSPAENAGLMPGDVIVNIDGKRIITKNDLRRALKNKEYDEIDVKYIRKGNERNVKVKLEKEFHFYPRLKRELYFIPPFEKFKFCLPGFFYRPFYYFREDDEIRDRLRQEIRDRKRYREDIKNLENEVKKLKKEIEKLKSRGWKPTTNIRNQKLPEPELLFVSLNKKILFIF